MALYMKAGSIRGSVKTPKHKDWITVNSCEFKITADLEELPEEAAKRTVEPDLGDMELEKPAGGSSPALLEWMLNGEALPEVIIEVCRDNEEWYLRHTLRGVVLQDFRMGVTEKGSSTATLTLKYDELQMEQIVYDKMGKKGPTNRAVIKRGTP